MTSYYLEKFLEKLNNGYIYTGGNRAWAFVNHGSHNFTLVDAVEPYIKIYPKNVNNKEKYIEIMFEKHRFFYGYGTIIFNVKKINTNELIDEPYKMNCFLGNNIHIDMHGATRYILDHCY